jgi:hypothetical protein
MLRLMIVPLLSLFVTGCAVLSREAPAEDLDKAGALFFQRFEKRDYDAIYDDVSSRFKANKTRQEVSSNLEQIAENGKVGDYRRISTSFEGEGKDRIVSPVFAVFFDQGKGDVTLNFVDEGGEWKLIGFAFKPRR